MKQSLRTNLLFLTLITGTGLFGQISGTVSINSGAAASATNFQNWESFWKNLQGIARTDGGISTGAGISASVTVDVKSSLTETSAILLPAISGTSSTSTLTIKGNGNYVAFAGPKEVISFSGADYITIDNLTIRNTGSNGARLACVRLYNNSDYNTIQNCKLEFSNLSIPSSKGSAYIAMAAIDTVFDNATSILTGSNNLFTGNLCRTTNSNSPGPSFGIALTGSTSGYSTTAHNNSVSNNTIENFYHYAISNIYSNGNQIIGNDISRANSTSNNCYTSLFGITNHITYGKSRSTRLGKNKMHDLPYSGAVSSGGVTNFYAFYGLYNRGTSAYPLLIDSNSISKVAVYENAQMGYFRDNNYLSVRFNDLQSLSTYSNSSAMMEWEFRVGDEFDFSYNSMSGCYLASQSSHFLYTDSMFASKTGKVTIHNNKIVGNKFFLDVYVLLPNEGNFDIRNNQITGNVISGGKGGYLFAIASQLCENTDVANNLIANNLGHDGFIGIYLQSYLSGNYTARVWQNTIFSDGLNAPGGKAYDNNGIYLETYYHQDIQMHGNITELRYGSSGIVTGIDCFDTSYITLWDNNTLYTVKLNGQAWITPLGTASDFSGYKSLGLVGSGENYVNPKFEDPANSKFKSYKWQTQNNVPTSSFNALDITGATRNLGLCDRGVYEQFTNLTALRTGYKVGASECAGKTGTGDITVKNQFSDTAINFYVASFVNGVKTTQKVTKGILPGDSLKITFTDPILLSKWGTNGVSLYIDAHDDKLKDDSFNFNTTVKPAPGGGTLKPTGLSTLARYNAGNQSNPDITIVGQPVQYSLTAPRQYSNTDYGSKWSGSAYAATLPGNISVSQVTYVIPGSGTDQTVKYVTNDRKLEDTAIKVCIKITDLVNGCDTTYCRIARINPSVDVAFTAPSLICGKDTAFFKSLSTVKKGGMRYHWDFGTGNAADTSDQPDAFFIYKNTGNYKVKLTVYTVPYGFVSADSITIKVSPKPIAAFSRTNACEKESITFTNQSTPSGISYKWNFGDNTTSLLKDPVHTYLAPGQYNVKLLVETGGCKDSLTQKAYMFNTPAASFNFQANQCSNSPVAFSNKSTCLNSTFASYWDFGGGNKSNQFEPVYTFGKPGNPPVKLLIVSSFGCKDSITKNISLREAPQVNFGYTEACSIDSTVFSDSSTVAAGTNQTYSWSFGDGKVSSAQNPWHKWSALGPKNVKLKISQTNGCIDSLTKVIIVKIQPVVDFISNSPVCYGKEVIFENKTTWAQGKIDYHWQFGDGVSDIISDPSHKYGNNVTTDYNVNLCAAIDSACRTCKQKTVRINEIPGTCDFDAQPDYNYGFYGIRCLPKTSSGTIGLQSGVTYSWNFENSGKVTSDTGKYNFQSDGMYNVTMCAEFAGTGCNCCVTKQVAMQRQALPSYGNKVFKVYPNPNNGRFHFELPESQSQWNISLFSFSGQQVFQMEFIGEKGSIEKEGLSAGIYIIKMSNGTDSYNQMLEIRD